MDELLKDLRFAIRTMVRRPAVFTLAAVSLALGIASNTTIFAAIDAYLLRPFPYPKPDRIVQVVSTNPERGWTHAPSSVPDFVDWRREASSFAAMGAVTGGSFNLEGGDRPERVQGARVSAGIFPTFGLPPLAGRAFTEAEESPAQGHVAVISESFWKRRFAGDRGIVGRPLTLDGEIYTVIGIMPGDFKFPSLTTDVWVPLTIGGTEHRDDRLVTVYGRMKDGVTPSGAEAEMRSLTARLASAFPEDREFSAHVVSYNDAVYGPQFMRGATMSMVAVAFVLLIACANVANLLLARGTDRMREIALRTAIGAGRRRIVQQLLTESVMLAVAAGALGTVLSIWGVRAFVSIVPPAFARTENISLDGRALAFTAILSLGCGILFGLAPALRLTRGDMASSLREGGRSGTMGVKHNRLGAALVMGEISLALGLLVSAGLLIKSSIKVQSVDLGFEPAGALSMRLALPAARYPDSVSVAAFHEQMARKLSEIPGVESASGAGDLPMRGTAGTSYIVPSEPRPETGKEPITGYRAILPNYLATLKVQLLEGRDVEWRDRNGAPRVVLVNETLAKKHWPTGSAIGRYIDLQDSVGPRQIVGVVHASQDWGADEEAPPMVYAPILQGLQRTATYVVRSSLPPATLASAMRASLASMDPGLPAYDVKSVQEIVDISMQSNFIMPRLLTVFGGLALLLAVIGVYGVMSYSVTQRTQEVGIRVALGAQGGDILRLIVTQGAIMAGAGLLVGLVLAAFMAKALNVFLIGVGAFDPVVFAGVTLALGAAALAASYVPARRALKVDPLVALRAD